MVSEGFAEILLLSHNVAKLSAEGADKSSLRTRKASWLWALCLHTRHLHYMLIKLKATALCILKLEELQNPDANNEVKS